MSFIGKVAIVVGGAGGIGSETARHLLLQGVDRLAILDVFYSQVGIERLQNEFPKKVIVFRKTDVTDRLEVERSYKEIVLKFERIDIVVNSVGIVNENSVENTLSVNLMGVITSTQTAIEHMSIEKGGRGGLIVNVASVVGLDGLFSAPLYTASKHAIVGFTRSLADPFYSNIYGIKFILICPGVTITPLIQDLSGLLYRADIEEPTAKLFANMGSQTAEECGRLLVEVLPKAENGSIWIVDAGNVKQVLLRKHWLKN